MGTVSTNLLPNETGLDLGSPDQQWDLFARNLQATNVTFDGVPVSTGDAKSLQGVPISVTIPTSGQQLTFNGTFWAPATAGTNATQIQGRPVSANAPVATQALIWDGAQWIPTNQSGGGGGASFGYVSVAFSATPTFTPSPVGSCTFEITLTGNVTSSTFTTAGLSAGTLMTFIINQDSTGNRTFRYPTGFLGSTTVGAFSNQTTVQQFLYNGTSFKAIALGVSYP